MTNMHQSLGQALKARGYDKLTPVQEAMLAPELLGADMLVSAQTGSGKTVAFGIAMAPTLLGGAEGFDKAGKPLALVIAPTRELALQVKRELEWLYAPAGARIASCVGGMDMRTERKDLSRGVHIVVGTPGRLLDHVKRKSLDLSEARAVVLDEADEMLDMGFRDDLEDILGAAPKERQTLLFSATVPKSILGLAKKYQNDAVRVNTAAESSQHIDIEYRALLVMPKDTENAIVNVLRYYEAKNAIVFCATRAAVNRLTSRFNNRGFSVVALSGELSQKERSNALQSLRDGRARVCIATDVAARGLDLPNLELVIHADLPKNSEGLLHRSGRTGRAGRKGVSALIVPVKGRKRAQSLLRSAKVEATWDNPPSASAVKERDQERLLEDPILTKKLSASEYEYAQTLIERFGAEQLAAAFARQYREGQSAPEELSDVTNNAPESVKMKREGMAEGVWFRLSQGRNQKLEPRWLLPLLRSAGKQNKRDIGAIIIGDDETHLELHARGVDKFMDELGADMMLDKGLSVEMLEKRPDGLVDRRHEPNRKSHDGPRAGRKRRAKEGGQSRPPRNDERGDGGKPKPSYKDSGAAPKKKKPHKKKLARAAARAAEAAKQKGGAPKRNNSPDKGAKLKRKTRKPS